MQLNLEKFESISQIARDYEGKKVEKMNLCEMALALVATYIGVGLLAMPFVIYSMGLVLGLITIFSVSLFTLMSFWLMLKTKDLTPLKPESMYEIAYVLFGRAAVFIVCLFIVLRNFGAIVLNYMIIGETWNTLMTEAFGHPIEDSDLKQDSSLYDNWWHYALTLKYTGVIVAGLLHAPIIFRR